MRFDWDPEKAASNARKHGVTFEEAQTVFQDDLFVTFEDPDHSHDENRFIIMGQSTKKNLLVVSYTERRNTIRLISADRRPEKSAEPMKKKSEQPDDELRPEYDFRSLRVVARGPGRRKPEAVTIQLAPDVAEAFPDSGAVNEALRFLLRITQRGLASRT